MPRLKLTQRAIHDLPAPHPSGKQTLYWDTEQRGFGLLVSGKTNTKSYVVQRAVGVGGPSRRITLVHRSRQKIHLSLAAHATLRSFRRCGGPKGVNLLNASVH